MNIIHIKLNINQVVSVKLTEKGKEIMYKENHSPYIIGYDPKTNILTTELWHVMNIFGNYIYNGCDTPFIGNIIELEIKGE